MIYQVQHHGDIIEKAASALVGSSFPHYELVWQSYVGNKGNDTMAEMPGYPDEKKRKDFAENSYSTLESIFLIDRILMSGIFEKPLTDFDAYIEFNKSFITFFALLGRIHDTAIKASNILKYDNTKFVDSIGRYYQARNVVIHGKKIPVEFDELGLFKIPVLKTSAVSGLCWDDKHRLWSEAAQMPTEYVSDSATNFFCGLLALVNEEFATFHHIIMQELKCLNCKLRFEYKKLDLSSEDMLHVPESSGTTQIKPVNVYNINNGDNVKKLR